MSVRRFYLVHTTFEWTKRLCSFHRGTQWLQFIFKAIGMTLDLPCLPFWPTSIARYFNRLANVVNVGPDSGWAVVLVSACTKAGTAYPLALDMQVCRTLLPSGHGGGSHDGRCLVATRARTHSRTRTSHSTRTPRPAYSSYIFSAFVRKTVDFVPLDFVRSRRVR